MKRTVLALLLLALLPAAPLSAQVTIDVGPVTATDKAAYDLTDATSQAQAQNTEIRLRVDATTGTFFVVVSPTCVTRAAGGFSCTGGLPPTILPVLNTRGKHAIRAYAFDPVAGVEGPSDIPFVLTTPAAAPMGLRFIRSAP